jgi:hypothetical protein
VNFSVTFAPPGWDIVPPPPIYLKSGSMASIPVSIAAPADAPPGEFDIRISASALGEVRANLTIHVMVEEFMNGSAEVVGPPYLSLTEPEPDRPSWGNITINVTSTGNYPGSFVAELTDQEGGDIWRFHNWTFAFELGNRTQTADSRENATFAFVLSPGESVLLRINVSVEMGYEDQAIPFRLKIFVDRGELEVLQVIDLFVQIES